MPKKFYQHFATLLDKDQRSITHLSKALETNNLSGFDYIEFKKSLSVISEMMDEETAIKSAYATASNIGLTKENLLQSITHYKQVLEKEKRQFDEALKNQIEEKVNQKQAEKSKLANQITQLEQQISEIQQKIAASQEKIDKTDAIVSEARTRIENTRDRFQDAYGHFIDALEQDYQKINNTI